MPLPEPARRPPRSWRSRAWALALVVGLVVAGACSSDAVRERAVRELAVGRWMCAADAEGADAFGFTVEIGADGTFAVVVELASSGAGAEIVDDELTGTWGVDDGDLTWAFDDPEASERVVVEEFDDLTLESTRFTMTSVLFEPNDGTDDPPEEQEILVDTHGTDSVTLRALGGEPWTCDRQ